MVDNTEMRTEKSTMRTLRMLLLLAVPTILEEVLSTLFQYVDTAMVGNLGEQATAAVSITTTVNWLIGSVYSAAGVAVLSLIARADGKKDTCQVRLLSMQALFLAALLGAVTMFTAVALSPFLPVWMGAEKAVCRDASVYFFVLSLSLPFRTLGTILGAALRAVKNVRTPLYLSIFANGINIVLNYFLIYAAGLGVMGAAISSTISYMALGVLMLRAYRKNQVLYWMRKSFRLDDACLKECARVGLPVFGTGAVSCMGYVVFARLVSGMGTTVFAAHSIAVTAETIFYIAGYGLRTATSTMVGNALGEGAREKLRLISALSVTVTMSMMCVNGVLLYAVSDPLMGLLTSSSQVAALGARMLRLVAFSEPFFGMMIAAEGIFYGLGRTKYPFLVETLSMWGIRIFFTTLVVLVWHMDLAAVWYCMIADNICKAVCLMAGVCAERRRLAGGEKEWENTDGSEKL